MNKIQSFFYKAFIAPFTSPERAIIYLCTMFGMFGFTGLLVYFAFDLTSIKLESVAGFFTGKFFFSNLFFLPLLFILIQRAKTPFIFLCFVIVQVAALATLFFSKHIFASGLFFDTFLIGVIISFITEPFWAVFHSLMLRLTTDENRGHEVSTAELGLQIGAATGSMGAGIMLTVMPGIFFPLGASFAMILASSFMVGLAVQHFSRAKEKPGYLSPYIGIFKEPELALATTMQGVARSLTTMYAPLWMKLVGFSALAVGSLTGAKLLARFLVGPFTGHLFEKSKKQELKLGTYIYVGSWAPWLFLGNALAFTISTVLWSLYLHMVNVGMDARWYARQEIVGMASREICLGLGRLITLVTVIPILALSTELFFIACIFTGVLFYVTVQGLKK